MEPRKIELMQPTRVLAYTNEHEQKKDFGESETKTKHWS